MKFFLSTLYFFGILALPNCLIAQSPPVIQFDRYYLDPTADSTQISYPVKVLQTKDKGYVALVANSVRDPYTLSGGAQFSTVFKTNSYGDTLWKTRDYWDTDPTSIIETSRGFMLTLMNHSANYGLGGYRADIVIIEIDSIGKELWRKVYDIDGGSDRIDKIVPLSNGNYMLVGFAYIYNPNTGSREPSTYVMMIDPLGNKLWDKTFANLNYYYNYGIDLIEKNLNSFYLLYQSFDYWPPKAMTLVNFNAIGDSLWSMVYNDPKYFNFSNIAKSNNDIIISVSAYRDSIGGASDAAILKQPLNANSYTVKVFRDSLYQRLPQKIIPTQDNGYMVFGAANRPNQTRHIYISKLDKDLNQICKWVYVNGNQRDEPASDIIQTSDEGFIISAGILKSIRLLKLGSFCVLPPSPCTLSADYIYSKDSAKTNYYYHFQNTTAPLSLGDSIYWSFGDSNSSNEQNPDHIYALPGKYAVCLRVQQFKTDGTLSKCVSEKCDTITVAALPTPTPANSYVSIFPNPTTNMLFINYPNQINPLSYSIYNLLGKIIKHGILSSGSKAIDISGLPADIYILKINDGNKVESKKFIKR